MTRALYLCYFGLREPLVQTQVLPYLRELVRGGVAMSLLTFEPDAEGAWVEEWRERLRSEGIEWHTLRYHKRPTLPATLFDIVAGAWRAARIVRRSRIDILHARSHVGAAIGALAKKLTGARLIFDVRGFLPEEYVDSGNWKKGGAPFRLTKAAERWLFDAADGFVVLTERARETLFPNGVAGKSLEVIPCCVSAERIAVRDDRDAVRRELGVSDRVVFVYVGALGGYYLTRETAELLGVARERDPRVFALVLTQSAAAPMIAELERQGFSASDYRVMRAEAQDVPRFLGAADVALSLIRASYARIPSSPTKFAEYLAAGLPVISTSGIGDLDTHIKESRVGVVLRDLNRESYDDALRAVEALRLDPELPERCRQEARTRYNLETVGGTRYRRLYDALSRRPLRVLALASYPIESASTRYRITQFVAPLAKHGIRVDFSPFLDASLFADLYTPGRMVRRLPRLALATLRRIGVLARAARADVVFVQREAMLFGPPLIEWFAARVLRRRMILDLDDATYFRFESPVYGRLATLLKRPGKTERLIRWSRVVTCGNPYIAADVRSMGQKASVVPSVVDINVFHPRETTNDVPVIGWIGTHTTWPFLERLTPVFDQLAREHRFRLTVIGSGRDDIATRPYIDARPWRMESEAEDFRSFDVGVYPLVDDAWNARKSGLKAVQYLASGIPFVMSPVGVCATMGVPDETHFLATTDEEWLAALRRLVTDAALRARMGRAGRTFAEAHCSLDAVAATLATVLNGTD